MTDEPRTPEFLEPEDVQSDPALKAVDDKQPVITDDTDPYNCEYIQEGGLLGDPLDPFAPLPEPVNLHEAEPEEMTLAEYAEQFIPEAVLEVLRESGGKISAEMASALEYDEHLLRVFWGLVEDMEYSAWQLRPLHKLEIPQVPVLYLRALVASRYGEDFLDRGVVRMFQLTTHRDIVKGFTESKKVEKIITVIWLHPNKWFAITSDEYDQYNEPEWGMSIMYDSPLDLASWLARAAKKECTCDRDESEMSIKLIFAFLLMKWIEEKLERQQMVVESHGAALQAFIHMITRINSFQTTGEDTDEVNPDEVDIDPESGFDVEVVRTLESQVPPRGAV